MSVVDLCAELFEACFRLFPVPARTGVRVIGTPDRLSPVFLTGNYDLMVRRVLRALRGLNAYLVVANSRGINVWCAASGGHLGTHQVVTALKLAQLEHRVVHREVIVPQLAATGVEGKEVRRRTGWIVRFGPVDAYDIPAYLAADKEKTQAMRQVRFDWRHRLEMAAAWATPISLIAGALGWRHLTGVIALVWGLAMAVFFLFDRIPLSDRGRQLLIGLGGVIATNVLLAVTGGFTLAAAAVWSGVALVVVWLLTFDFAGSSPTAPAGIFEERLFTVALDLDKCVGAYTCWAVCPEAVFEKRPDIHKVTIAHGDRCIRCGACLVQCPQDALSFATPDGQRVGPETIRRFKLNMMGKRAARVSDTEAGGSRPSM
jgi:ferredoxin